MNDPIWTCMLLAVLCGGMAGAAGFSAMREDEPGWRAWLGAMCGLNVVAAVWLIIKGIVLLLANS